MPSFQLPGRTHLTALRSILSRSLGFSRTFNARNLEHYWYPCWNHQLFDLIADIPNVIVAPQFPVWYAEQDEEQDPEGPQDGGDLSEDRVETGEDSLGDAVHEAGNEEPEDPVSNPEVDETELGIADLSFTSSEATVPQKDAFTRVTDFAIVHITAEEKAHLMSRYGGWRVARERVSLLVEEKRYPSRSLTPEQLDRALVAKLKEARLDLRVQAAYLFCKDHETTSVMAIAASGPYWSNTIISRPASVTPYDIQPLLNAKKHHQLMEIITEDNWTIPLRLDTAKSNDRLRTVYKRLKSYGVLEVKK